MKNNAYDNKLCPKRTAKEHRKLKAGDILEVAYKDCKQPVYEVVVEVQAGSSTCWVWTHPILNYLTKPQRQAHTLNSERWSKIDTLKRLAKRNFDPRLFALLRSN